MTQYICNYFLFLKEDKSNINLWLVSQSILYFTMLSHIIMHDNEKILFKLKMCLSIYVIIFISQGR